MTLDVAGSEPRDTPETGDFSAGEGAGPAAGDTAVPRIPLRGHYSDEARIRRLEFLRAETGAPLSALEELALRPHRLTRNVENLIGAVEVPVGVAGPLLVHGQRARGFTYAPLATTEGALVLSATRGAKALTLAGGVNTRVISQRMTRAPLFVFEDMRRAHGFAGWVRTQFHSLRDQAQRVSGHARLVSIEPVTLGNHVHVLFVYETGEAAGQNMTTSCTWHACQWVLEQLASTCDARPSSFYIEGNLSADKKVAFQSLAGGRGVRVSADAFIDRRVLRRVLKVTPEEMAGLVNAGKDAALAAGYVGFNVNIANIVAGIFIATGQDVACVHESSLGLLRVEPRRQGLYVAMELFGLVVGTVGGGTHLPRQRELLEMLGCTGRYGPEKLAEIIAGFCLALDLSTTAAAATGEFQAAHERLGRNRPVRPLAREELGPEFFTSGLRAAFDDDRLEVTGAHPLADGHSEHSIITELASRRAHRLLGLFPYRLTYDRPATAKAGAVDVMVKVKPTDEETILLVDSVARLCGKEVAVPHARFKRRTGFAGCDRRELALYGLGDARLRRHTPRVYGIVEEPARESYVLILEHLKDAVLLDAADQAGAWGREHIEAALRGVAEVHSSFYGRERDLLAEPWLGRVMTASDMVEMAPLWQGLAAHAHSELPSLFTRGDLERSENAIATLGTWWPALEAMPRTLVHNDFNPRNIALRREPGGYRLCAYDWELATLQVPQHDLAELLSFVLGPDTGLDEVRHYGEVHRRALEEAGQTGIDPILWRRGYALCLLDLWVNRFAFYLMGHSWRHYGFLTRALRTLGHLIDLETGPAGALGRVS